MASESYEPFIQPPWRRHAGLLPFDRVAANAVTVDILPRSELAQVPIADNKRPGALFASASAKLSGPREIGARSDIEAPSRCRIYFGIHDGQIRIHRQRAECSALQN